MTVLLPLRRVEADPSAPADLRAWPATLAPVRQVLHEGLDLGAVTVLTGENGVGKSTLVEAIAVAWGLGAEGGTTNVAHRSRVRPSESDLSDHLRLVRGAGTSRKGFFLRAETMHGLFTDLRRPVLPTSGGAARRHRENRTAPRKCTVPCDFRGAVPPPRWRAQGGAMTDGSTDTTSARPDAATDAATDAPTDAPTADSLAAIGTELSRLVGRVVADQGEALDALAAAVGGAPRVFVHGTGRSGLALQMTAMRLMHLGLTVHVVGEVTSPAIGGGDVLLTASGSGTTGGIVRAAGTARDAGARVVALTTDAGSPLADLAEVVVVVPAAGKQDRSGQASAQYAGGLFEQAVVLLGDAVFDALWHRSGATADELWPRHANLE